MKWVQNWKPENMLLFFSMFYLPKSKTANLLWLELFVGYFIILKINVIYLQ